MKSIDLPVPYKYISAFLTMRCNLSCSYCLNEFSERFNRKSFKELSGEEWIDSLNKINSVPEVPITFSGGESSLHKDFIEIINGIKPETNIDILTNLMWGEKGIEKFISKVDPARLKRDSSYASIRASYHPEQMGSGATLVKNAKKLQEAGFQVGLYAVQYPGKEQLEAITQMQFRCLDEGIDFRVKDFTGKFEGVDDLGRPFSILHGDYSKYPNCSFQEETRTCECKTSELLIGSNGDVYRCHRDVFSREFPRGNIADPNFQIEDRFLSCNKYGQCHPCDVKLKTNYKQELGHTSVNIRNIK